MTTKRPAPRVTYRKAAPATDTGDYVDARFDILLDGEPTGAQVTRDRTSRVDTYSGRVYGYRVDYTEWAVEARGYRDPGYHRTRVDAVMDYLRQARNFDWETARAATGKRGLF